MVTGDVAQISIFAKNTDGPSQVALNINYIRATGQTGAGATDLEVANVLSTKIGPVLRAAMPLDAQYLGLLFTHIFPGFREQRLPSLLGAGVGGIASSLLPLQVTGIVSRRTFFAGRRFRGRIYVPFPAASSVDTDHQPTVAYVALAQNYGTAVHEEDTVVGAGGSTTYVSVLRQSDPVKTPATWDIVTGIFVPKKYGTQRRRGSYGQANISPF